MSSKLFSHRVFHLSVYVLALAMIAGIGAIGCSRAPIEPSAAQGRARALERRCVQLEQDYRTVAEARDAINRELTEARAQLTQQREVLQQFKELSSKLRISQADHDRTRQALIQRTVERDNLRAELTARMTEREVLMVRCEKLRKGLQSLLTQDDGTLPEAAGNQAIEPVGSE